MARIYLAVLCITISWFSTRAEDDKKLFFKSHIPDEVTKARLGQGLVLDCEAGGYPTPTVHWLFKGSRIPQVSYLRHYNTFI